MNRFCISCAADGQVRPYDPIALRQALAGIDRVFVLAHGLGTDARDAAEWFDDQADVLSDRLGNDCLLVELHWPSALEDGGGPVNCLSTFAFWEMEARARVVGSCAAVAIADAVRLANPDAAQIFAGHSLGAVVAASALTAIAKRGNIAGRRYGLVLLQGAMPFDDLESGRAFGPVQAAWPDVRITRSEFDDVLRCGFAIGEAFENQFKPALGFAGPSRRTVAAYGHRLTVLDLSPWRAGHADVATPPVADLIAGCNP